MKKFGFLAVVIVFGLAMFSGCATITGKTTGEFIDDSNITAQVNSIIVKDPDSQLLKIDVKTTQGEVVLQGFVKNRDIETRLLTQIMDIRGVNSVESLLKLEKKSKPVKAER